MVRPASWSTVSGWSTVSSISRTAWNSRLSSTPTLLGAGRRRASALEMTQWAACEGRVMERCLELEQEREALELRWLQDIAAAERIGEGALDALA